MNQETWTAVDNYIADHFLSPDPVLEATLVNSAAAGLPTISITPQIGMLLMLLARSHNARRILEIGTLGGYSTIWLARALPDEGRLLTLEASPKHAEVARANITNAGLIDRVEVRTGFGQELLPQLVANNEGPFDLIFIDADKPGYPEYLAWSLKLSRPGTLIIADNVIRQGAITKDDSQDENVLAVRRFNELLAAEPRLTATIFQMVGSKGYDGLAMALVN